MKALPFRKGSFTVWLILGMVLAFAAAWPSEGLAQNGKAGASAQKAKKASKTKAKKPTKNKSFNSPLKGSIRLTIADAVLLAFEHNLSLGVERLYPLKSRTYEDEKKSVFDVVLGAGISGGREEERKDDTDHTITNTFSTTLSLSKYFTPGTEVTLGVTGRTTDSDTKDGRDTTTNLEVEITQPLLRGYGSKVNLVALHQAELTTKISHYEFRGFCESLLAEVEKAYWNHALALRQVEIVQQSLEIAQRQLKETQEMIRVGVRAETELPATKAEVATQKQALIEAKSASERTRLSLLRLMNPPGDGLFERELVLAHPPTLPELKLGSIEGHVRPGPEPAPGTGPGQAEHRKGRSGDSPHQKRAFAQAGFLLAHGQHGLFGILRLAGICRSPPKATPPWPG